MTSELDRTPRSLLVWDRSSFLDPRNRLSAQVQQLHFNYKVSVLLPGCSSAPSHLDAAFNSLSKFYLIRNLNVHELLDKDFLLAAVYTGRVSGLSYGTRIDEDTCIALTSDGHLSLSLDKDSFELLGFEGKPSRFNQRTNSRFVVSVDLTDGRMAPGSPAHTRLSTGLRSRLHLRTDFLLSHAPGGGACLQDFLSRYDWTEHRPVTSSRVLTDLTCPLVTSEPCDPHHFLEWLGTVDAAISCENSSSSFLSSLVCPEPKTSLSRALSVSVSGFLRPDDVHQLIEDIRCFLETPGTASWASVTVHGFMDSPVSWRHNEHGVLRGGQNFYSLLLLEDKNYQLYLSTGGLDICPP